MTSSSRTEWPVIGGATLLIIGSALVLLPGFGFVAFYLRTLYVEHRFEDINVLLLGLGFFLIGLVVVRTGAWLYYRPRPLQPLTIRKLYYAKQAKQLHTLCLPLLAVTCFLVGTGYEQVAGLIAPVLAMLVVATALKIAAGRRTGK